MYKSNVEPAIVAFIVRVMGSNLLYEQQNTADPVRLGVDSDTRCGT
jgi:hypothetical protein